MDKAIFKKVEGRLYRYYKDIESIEMYSKELELLKNQLEVIEDDKRIFEYVRMEPESMNISYEEKFGGNGEFNSHAERELFKQVEKLKKEGQYIRRRIHKLEYNIREIKRNINSLEYAIGISSKTCKDFLEYRYKDKLSLEEIADNMFLVKSTAIELRQRIIRSIADTLNMV